VCSIKRRCEVEEVGCLSRQKLKRASDKNYDNNGQNYGKITEWT
jgi:hypothetical protein